MPLSFRAVSPVDVYKNDNPAEWVVIYALRVNLGLFCQHASSVFHLPHP